ncbi:MAG: transcription termination/antitermination protein NusA [Candidatus Kerfeldbacteria bacterium CG08_land_8_20_14_0_20_42_7]|uniref:Transcription termination/antitermination protein NusA n=1 Tax=Candidatus Kerfeldbacteria bacterium CG08_land_8_20_14_0_20_42_7 TaxID=2014245 RepID=A0A2H0YSI3_9BACT|nr:MAG: transcription termination/antitermination protein NusA [Candidatus Kerfeldbacteria bacterium CG08_land_8_20_14_0_20_42_7]
MAEAPIVTAIRQISEEKNIPLESVISTIEAALAVAYRKDFGEKNQNIKVTFKMQDGTSQVFDVKTVVPDALKKEWDKMKAEEEKARADAEAEGLDYAKIKQEEAEKKRKEEEVRADKKSEDNQEKEVRYDPKLHLSLSEAKKIRKDAKLEEEVVTELFPPASYGRMAAQTAKQVIIQRLREAEREMVFSEYKGKEGELINATIQRVEGRLIFVDLGHATAIMPPQEQIRDERYTPGNRIKVYILSVNSTPKGPEIIVSRSHQEIVRKLFSLEVPEIANGSVEIKAIAREAGHRTKIAVFSSQKNIDPIGSCVGQRGSRVQTVITELGGEKIDIIEWSEDSVQFIVNALSPAKIISVTLNEEEKIAAAEVKTDQLSLAIGKQGQNVRLSSKLTGWKIDIVGEEGAPVAPEANGPESGTGEKTQNESSKKDESKEQQGATDETKENEPTEKKELSEKNQPQADKPKEKKSEELAAEAESEKK